MKVHIKWVIIGIIWLFALYGAWVFMGLIQALIIQLLIICTCLVNNWVLSDNSEPEDDNSSI